MSLSSVPSQPFEVTVKTWAPTKYSGCPSPPQWLKDLVKDGATLQLGAVLIQAGRHFADALNPEVLPGTGSRRQKATQLAWYLIATMNPTVVGNRLVVERPGDTDIQRIASEVLGVGAGLELLRSQERIDARTLDKDNVGGSFDFTASPRGGIGKIKIELKGCLDGNRGRHQASFWKKLENSGLLKPGAARGYSSAIGLIFSGWTKAQTSGADFQIVDPEVEPLNDDDSAIRAVIKFYARRLDQDFRLDEGAKRLWDLSQLTQPLRDLRQSKEVLGRHPSQNRRERVFNRTQLELGSRTFWGGFWSGTAMPPPVGFGDQLSGMRFGYLGIDRRPFELMRDGKWDDLLAYKCESSMKKFDFHEGNIPIRGFLITDETGVIRAWFNAIPDGPIMLE